MTGEPSPPPISTTNLISDLSSYATSLTSIVKDNIDYKSIQQDKIQSMFDKI